MKKLELIQIEDLDANFVMVYDDSGELEFANYWQGINDKPFSFIEQFANSKDDKFYKIFQILLKAVDTKQALRLAWEIKVSQL